jgi:uncharacterized coiled-coil protein SlyX
MTSEGSKIEKELLPGRVLCLFGSLRQIKTIQTRPGKRKNTFMYSLNQVNKLVSCGRDPARSLPLWRGFLLIPLILVCFTFAPQTRAAVELSPPPDGCYPGFTTAEGCDALKFVTTGVANTGLGWRALFSANDSSFSTGVGAAACVLNRADANTGVGAAALLLNTFGGRNTAVGAAAMVFNDGNLEGQGSFNGAFGAFALNANEDGFSNNAMGDSALFRNIHAAANVAVGDLALENNDATGDGAANNNVAVGASAFINDVNGSENTGVGSNVGPNIANGFNNTYIGNFVGSALAADGSGDEDSTIRIGDISNGNGAGSLACYIGGIWNNPQPVGGSVVVVTLNLDNDQLGYDAGAARSGSAPAVPNRAAPQPRARPVPHQAMLNDKVEKLQATVAQQQVTVAQQQKQIETLTTQLREQAAQLQKVSAQVEMIRPTPRVVENR